MHVTAVTNSYAGFTTRASKDTVEWSLISYQLQEDSALGQRPELLADMESHDEQPVYNE